MLRLGSPSTYLQRKRAPYAQKCHIGNFSAGTFILEQHPLMMQMSFTDKGTPRGVFPFMDSLGYSQILLILFFSPIIFICISTPTAPSDSSPTPHLPPWFSSLVHTLK